jgi:hypothetical protein
MGSNSTKATYVQDRTQAKRGNGGARTNGSAVMKASRSQKKTRNNSTVGGWTEQDLENPQILNDAKQLAIVATKDIAKDVTVKGIDYDTINISYLTSQVVNGTNYRIEYSIKDRDGDNIVWVTAQMFRAIQDPISRAQVVDTDYQVENINISQKDRPGPINRERTR